MKLPDNINYTRFYGNGGMCTSYWGSAFWNALFTSILGHYPVKIDVNNNDHRSLVKNYKNLMCSLSEIMPCIFCRKSFKQFFKELPIDDYLIGRIELFYWLYLMKDKVNNKLINQEKKCYNTEKIRLKELYHTYQLSENEYYSKIKSFKKNTFVTIPTPPFEQVLHKYEKYRAVCDPKAKKCSTPRKFNNLQ
jgi:hypothetical protein